MKNLSLRDGEVKFNPHETRSGPEQQTHAVWGSVDFGVGHGRMVKTSYCKLVPCIQISFSKSAPRRLTEQKKAPNSSGLRFRSSEYCTEASETMAAHWRLSRFPCFSFGRGSSNMAVAHWRLCLVCSFFLGGGWVSLLSRNKQGDPLAFRLFSPGPLGF